MMKSAFSFLPGWPLAPDIVLWVGLTLFAAGLFGEFCWRTWRLPRITGYALIGLLAGPAGFGVIDAQATADARLLMDMALGLLLFELGNRLSLRWIRSNPWLVVSSLAESLLAFGAILTVLLLLGVPSMTSIIVAAIGMATSPAMVIQLKTELHSAGQVTERMLALSALNSMYAVVVTKIATSWLHQEYYGNMLATVVQPLYLIGGSLLLAYVLARACIFLYRHAPQQDEHSFVALIGLVLLAIALAHVLKLSTILALLAAGILFKNLDVRPQLWPPHFGSAGWLLTVVLFVLTLISFQWKYIALGGLAALAMCVARLVAKTLGVLVFSRVSGIDFRQGAALGVALSPMSALAFLLVDDTYTLYPDFDPALRAIVLCGIALMQLLGPFLVYRALRLAGERPQ